MAAFSVERIRDHGPVPVSHPPAKIMLIEHDFKVAQLIRRVISGAGYEVHTVDTAGQALDPAVAFDPACIILHLCACGGDSALELVSDLRSRYEAPLMVISEVTVESVKVRALELGADDYLTRPFGMREFVARLGALLRRRPPGFSSRHIKVGDLEIDRLARRVFRCGEEVQLTRKEFQILACLAQSPGVVVPSVSILSQAWGAGFVHYSQTLRVHIGRLRQKLRSVPPAKDFIRTAAGVGYALVPE